MSVSKPTTLFAHAVNCAVILICVACAAPLAAQTQPARRTDAATAPASQTPTPALTPAPASQTPSPAPTPAPVVPAAPTADPDLSITGNVTARELLFEVVPTATVEFPGRPRRDTVWEAERTNLPPQVQPGVTYRDIGIRLKITSVFADIERIVAEALGEIPAPEADASPETDSNPNPPSPAGTPRTTNEPPPPVVASPTVSSTQDSTAKPSAPAGRPRVRNDGGSAGAQRERP